MADFGVGFKLTADATSFQREMRNAVTETKKIESGFRDIGLNMKQYLGAGAVIAGFRAIISTAQEMRDLAEEHGHKVDDGVRSVAELGDAYEEAKGSLAKMAVAGLSFFTRAGEGIGMFINRLRGVTKEQEDLYANIEKAADAAEKKLAEAYKNREQLAKERARDAKKNDDDAMEAEKKKYKYKEEGKKLDEKLSELRGKKISDEQKLEKVNKEIAKYEAFIRSGGELTNDGKKELLELLEKQKSLTKDVAEKEKEIEQTLQEQKKTKIEINTVGRGDRQLSDRELARKISTLSADVSNREIAVARGAYDGLLGPQKYYLQQALAEQNLRSKVRREVRAFGENRAFDMNSGLTESRFSEIMNTATQLDGIEKRLLSIDQRLAGTKAAGLPVFTINKQNTP